MNEESKSCDELGAALCDSRRNFLVKATTIAGGLVLGLTSLQSAAAQKKDDAKIVDNAAQTDEIILKLDAKSPLNKVGGYDTIQTKDGKVVVVRTAEMTFSAYSAVCPHKGGPIKFDEKFQQLFCPWHNSRFDLQGQVVKGPAKQPLTNYIAENAVVIELKPKQ
ncbi:MAG: Rieske (2Fe-2S) protein [Pyrinomonadaceae bacterium]